MDMVPLDYGRSFVLGKGAANEVRFWVESRTRIIDEKSGHTEDYIQCASCKSEDVFAEQNLFYKDNHDFLPVFGPVYGLIFRRKAWLNPNYRSRGRVQDMWGGQICHLVEAGKAQLLRSPQEIFAAAHGWNPIVAQTEIRNGETGLRAVVEYPVKTLNTRRQPPAYQVDSGPVAFPRLRMRAEETVDLIALAFIAFNTPHFADVIIEAPTPIPAGQGDDTIDVHHYSRRVNWPAVNRLYAIP